MSHAKINEVGRTLIASDVVEVPKRTPAIEALKQALLRYSGPGLAVRLGLLAFVLTIPALFVGFAQDDHFFIGVFEGSPGLEGLEQSMWNTFTFSEGDPARNALRMEKGILPWWAVSTWEVNLWRPLASLSHWVDYQLFGANSIPMHLHSMALYGALCLCVTLLYRKIMGAGWAYALAALMFAVDAAHGVPVGWLSNRNALLAAFFGVLMLLAHHAWRQTATPFKPAGKWQTYGVLANGLLLLALFSGEAAVAVGGYVFAYALFIDPVVRGTRETPIVPTRRAYVKNAVRSFGMLLPYLAVVIVWRAVYQGLGHGTEGSWMYVDPLMEPLVFLQNAVFHFPVLALGLFGVPDSTIWMALPALWQNIYAAVAVGLMAFGVWMAWPLIRGNAYARFWALGAFIALIPVCATLPTDRNLMYPSIGAMPLMALFVAGFVDRARWVTWRPVWRRSANWAVAAIVLVHVVAAPFMLLGSSYAIAKMDEAFTRANAAVPADATERLVVINTPVDLLGASLPLFRSGQDIEVPESWTWLCANGEPVEVERTGESTLLLRPDGGYLQRPWSQIFRRPDTHPLHAGDTVNVAGMTARVMSATDDGRPSEVQFTFDVPLEDAGLRWLTWSEGSYVPFTLPRVGETVHVPGIDPAGLLRLAFGLDSPRELTPVTPREPVKVSANRD